MNWCLTDIDLITAVSQLLSADATVRNTSDLLTQPVSFEESAVGYSCTVSTIHLLFYFLFVYIYAYFLSLLSQSHIMFRSSMYFVSIWVSVLNVQNWRHAAASHMDVFLCELPLSSLQQYMRTQRLTWTKEIKAWEGPPSQQRQVPLKPKSTMSTQTWELGLHLNGMHLQNTS